MARRGRGRTGTRTGWVVAAIGAGLVLLLWATAAGDRPLLQPPTGPLFEPPDAGPRPQPSSTTTARVPGSDQDVLVVDRDLVPALVVIALLLVVALLVRWWSRRRERTDPRDTPELVPQVLIADDEAAGQVAVLAGGRPRNAIVACWLRLETAVAAAGVPLRPSETSTELTVRVLSARMVDRRALTELGALYREARFSRHEPGEEDRARAMVALRTVHRDLRRRGRP